MSCRGMLQQNLHQWVVLMQVLQKDPNLNRSPRLAGCPADQPLQLQCPTSQHVYLLPLTQPLLRPTGAREDPR